MMVKELTMDCEEVIDYVKKNVKAYDNVELEEIKYDLIEVKHIPQDGDETLITIDTCEEEFEE
jgi:hypothetical protein